MPSTPADATRSTVDFTAAPHRWPALVAIALGTSLVVMDATIANVALPVIIGDLGLSATEAQWVGTVYALVFASLMLTSGRLGDLFGRRMMFLAGLVVFMVSSLVGGAAVSPLMLILARLVQGVGAAMVLPATASSINAMFVGRERGIAFAVFGSAIGGMAAVGPLVGGWLAADVTWRWALWLNIPVGLIVLALAARYMIETRDRTLQRGIDWGGTILGTLGLAAIVFALVEASSYGWVRREDGRLSPVIVSLVGGVGIMIAWALLEKRRERSGRIVQTHLGLWRIGNFRNGAIAATVIALGEFGMLFALPLVLQGAMGYDALATGWLILVLAVGTFLMSAGVPHLSHRFGARRVLQFGVLIEALAVIGLALALPGRAWILGLCLFVYGIGVGMATAQVTNVSLAEVPVALSGEASGLLTTVRQLGAALGVALIGGLLISSLTSGTQARLDAAGVPEPGRTQVVTAVKGSIGAAIPSLRARSPEAAALASDALIDAARLATGVAGGILGGGFLATLAIRQVSVETVRRRRQESEEQLLDVEGPGPETPGHSA